MSPTNKVLAIIIPLLFPVILCTLFLLFVYTNASFLVFSSILYMSSFFILQVLYVYTFKNKVKMLTIVIGIIAGSLLFTLSTFILLHYFGSTLQTAFETMSFLPDGIDQKRIA